MNVSRLIMIAPLILALSLSATAQEPGAAAKNDKTDKPQGKAPASRPKRKPIPAFQPYEGKPGLPNVLLLGDSISMGYTLPVRTLLEGKANVYRPLENCMDTQTGLEKLDKWLGDTKWDVIHFNWGMHDFKYVLNNKVDDAGTQVRSAEDYEKNLTELAKRLKATGAELIWASTTPVPPNSAGRKVADAVRYNAAAKRVMDANGIAIDDLFSLMAPVHDKYMKEAGNVHYSEAGYDFLAKQVAAEIESKLKARKK